MTAAKPASKRARFVEGDMPIYFVYTAGVAGDEFLKGLRDGKLLASKCSHCNRTYCPPRIFCETCLEDIHDLRRVSGAGAVESFTRLHVGLDGTPLKEPVVAAAIRLDRTDATLIHKLGELRGSGPRIGMKVAPVWSKDRTGSILDIQYFRPAGR